MTSRVKKKITEYMSARHMLHALCGRLTEPIKKNKHGLIFPAQAVAEA